MSSPLTLILLGQVYLLGTAPTIPLTRLSDSSPILSANSELGKPALASQYKRGDYTYTPGVGAHKIHSVAKKWNAARKICEEEGGYLAIVNSLAESEAIAKLFPSSYPHIGSEDADYALIGFHDLYEEGQYVTIHGESIEKAGFDVWSDGEPNNGGGAENCGSVMKNGKLNDATCDKPLAFVCELPGGDQNTPIVPFPAGVTPRDETTETRETETDTTTWTPATPSGSRVPTTTDNSRIYESETDSRQLSGVTESWNIFEATTAATDGVANSERRIWETPFYYDLY